MSNLETIVSISPGSGVDIWNLATGSLKHSIKLQAGAVSSTPVFVDSEHIFVRIDRQIAIINIHTGNVKSRSTFSDPISTLTLSHDQQYLVGGSESGRIYIWFFSTGELIRIFDAHYKAISVVKFSDDGTFLLTGSLDGSCSLWVLSQVLNIHALLASSENQSRLTPFLEFNQHSLPVTSITMGSSITSGGRLFTSSLDNTIAEYHLPTKSVRKVLTLSSPVTATCLSRNELYLYAGCADGTIHAIPLYDTQQYQSSLAGGIPAHPTAAFTGNGGNQTMGNESAAGMTTLIEESKYDQFIGHSGRITSLSTSLHDNLLVSSSVDGIRVWVIATRQPKNVLVGQHRNISCAGININPLAHLNATDDRLRKREFPLLGRVLRLPLHIHQNAYDVPPGSNCFTGVPVVLPTSARSIINDDNYASATHEENSLLMDQLYAMIDVPTKLQ